MSQPQLRISLFLTWKIAAIEAANLHQTTIAPAHFFIALLKIIEIDVGQLVNEEGNASHEKAKKDILLLKNCIGEFILDAITARRFLRAILPVGDERHSLSKSHKLSRSNTSKCIFHEAENIAQKNGTLITPIHLLGALLKSGDAPIQTMLAKLDVDPSSFAQYCSNFISRRD
jgi:hypothetical protein